jgi:hypothetical protein
MIQGGPCHGPPEGHAAIVQDGHTQQGSSHMSCMDRCVIRSKVQGGRPTEYIQHTPSRPLQTRISFCSPERQDGVPDGLKWKAQTQIRITSARCLGCRDSKITANGCLFACSGYRPAHLCAPVSLGARRTSEFQCVKQFADNCICTTY